MHFTTTQGDNEQFNLLLCKASDFFEAERYDFTITTLLNNIELYSQQFLLHDLLARAYLFNDQPREAVFEALIALSLSSEKSSSHDLLGMVYTLNRQPLQALKHYLLAIRYSPTDLSLYLQLVKTLFFETLWFGAKLLGLS